MSLLNPYAILGIVFAIIGAFGSGYYKGGEAEAEKQQLEIARLNNEARQKEQALVSAVHTTATQLVKANNDAKIQIAKRNSDIDSGTLRLRIPVKPTVCPVHTPGDPPAPSGTDTGTAELQPETAKDILAVGDDADATIRKLNACITAYNQIREALNPKGKP
jgi:hypothetical protein